MLAEGAEGCQASCSACHVPFIGTPVTGVGGRTSLAATAAESGRSSVGQASLSLHRVLEEAHTPQ